MVDIERIDRFSQNEYILGNILINKEGSLRYWTNSVDFYTEDSKMVHFIAKDADKECSRRNIERYGIEFCKQLL